MHEGAMKAREKSAIVLKDVYDIIGFVKQWCTDQNF